MKKDVVFWVGVKSSDTLLNKKHGNFQYLKYSKFTWKYWCDKNNVEFVEYNTPTLSDTSTHKVTWQRWFDVFPQLDQINIQYDKILVTDGSIMIKWDAPNFFKMTSSNLHAFKSMENINWINEGIEGYRHLFPNISFNLKKYISCGFQIFTKEHSLFLDNLKKFYFDNLEEILILQNKIGRGTDQPIYNYLLQFHNTPVSQDLPDSFWLMHMNRFNWFSYNWQLNEDTTPYFIKYGYIWVFSGFDRTQRVHLMKQTWDIIKHNYE